MIKSRGKKNLAYKKVFFFSLGNDNHNEKKIPEVFLRSFADIVCQWESFVPH